MGLAKRRVTGHLSPDSVLLLVFQNPARVIVVLVYDQVSISVVTRVKVGDYTGGNSQASHHCRKDRKSSDGLL